jgi:hypothetical protein
MDDRRLLEQTVGRELLAARLNRPPSRRDAKAGKTGLAGRLSQFAKCRALVRPASMRTDEAAGVVNPAIAFAQVRAPE